MRRLFVALTSAISLVAFTHMASAADLYQPVNKAAPPAALGWTGWYVGVNAGASMGNAKTDFNGVPIFGTLTPPAPITGTEQFTPGFGFSDRNYPSGFIGGGQIGYNWWYSPLFVVGVEADFQGALEKDTANNLTQNFSFTNFNEAGLPISSSEGTVVTSYTTQIDWFGTVRARLGYVWGNGEVQTYVTGGLAYGEVKINGASTVSGMGCAFGGCGESFSNSQTFGQSHVNTGWVL